MITDELINRLYQICKESRRLNIFIYFDINSREIKKTTRPWEDLANTENESILTYDASKDRFLSENELKFILNTKIRYFLTEKRDQNINSILI